MKDSIKIGFDSNTNLYTFKTMMFNNLNINGKSVEDPLLGYKNGGLYVISEKPETVTYSTASNVHVGWIDEEVSLTLSCDEYMKELIAFNRTWDDDEEIWKYDTLEDEVKATRFLRAYKKKFEIKKTINDLEIEFIEYPISQYKEIVPLYTIDTANIFSTKCRYTPDLIGLFRTIMNEYGIDDKRIDIPSHSGLRFVKIDGDFISGMEEFQQIYGRSILGSYEECIERMDAAEKQLRQNISFHFAKKSQKTLNITTVGNLLKQLQSLKNNVNHLDVKVKETSARRHISIKIQEMIQKYQELA